MTERRYVILKKIKEAETEAFELIDHVSARDNDHARRKADRLLNREIGEQIAVIPHSSFHVYGY